MNISIDALKCKRSTLARASFLFHDDGGVNDDDGGGDGGDALSAHYAPRGSSPRGNARPSLPALTARG